MYQRFAQNCKIRKSNWIQPATPIEVRGAPLTKGVPAGAPGPSRERTADRRMEAAAAAMPGPQRQTRRLRALTDWASRVKKAYARQSLSATFRGGTPHTRSADPVA